MSYTERHIVETFSHLFSGLSAESKRELIESLSKSIQDETKSKETKFYNSFGAFGSDLSAKDIIKNIKGNRSFSSREIKF